MENEKWYFKNSTVVWGFILVGPLALPLVWFNPKYNWKVKLGVTVFSIVVTTLMSLLLARVLNNLLQIKL